MGSDYGMLRCGSRPRLRRQGNSPRRHFPSPLRHPISRRETRPMGRCKAGRTFVEARVLLGIPKDKLFFVGVSFRLQLQVGTARVPPVPLQLR